MKEFKLHDAYITLTQFLKANAYIASGGQAKFFLLETDVYVNGDIRKERKKKLYAGDVIQINHDRYVLTHD